jgi:tRNA U34 5-methylaminomethyl-2-thiouridine-forming methyltransferase MnmC
LERKIITTSDGSTSLYIPELNENYHSTHGAIQESMHVFIEAGLQMVNKPSINIFEMGYGTGLNFLLTLIHGGKRTINYHGIEAYPLEPNLINQLNYASQLDADSETEKVFSKFHEAQGTVILTDKITATKEQVTLSNYIPKIKFDLVYFDAFAPEVQPELWTPDVFDKIFNMMYPGGILTTYCAKGQVRRNMISSGFKVERIPGPPGKRQMMRATKC